MSHRASRRRFIQWAGMGSAAMAGFSRESRPEAAPNPAAGKPLPYQLGMASYTFRKFPLEKALEMTRRLGLSRIAFKDFHLAMDSTPGQIQDTLEKVREAGLELYGGGVIYMRSEADVNRAFDYAKAAGMKIIIGVPNHEFLGLVNHKVQSYDIRVAIHNHGPTDKVYPTPESAYARIKGLDKRIGLCIDVGHTQRSGVDPAEAAKTFADRMFDLHVKDVTSADAKGSTVEIGRGVVNIPKLLRTLEQIRYQGTVALEYEKDADDPLPGAAESIGYLRGVMNVL